MTIDAHVHVGDLEAVEYSRLTPEFTALYRTFAFDEVVLVQAADNSGDTEHMRAVADANPRVGGIVYGDTCRSWYRIAG